ncbi:hypothetical protein DXG01_010628 [Tephrocybe rancida]|nr:hypothetical protein DXG01_010628 [Tephrocybe rancida]
MSSIVTTRSSAGALRATRYTDTCPIHPRLTQQPPPTAVQEPRGCPWSNEQYMNHTGALGAMRYADACPVHPRLTQKNPPEQYWNHAEQCRRPKSNEHDSTARAPASGLPPRCWWCAHPPAACSPLPVFGRWWGHDSTACSSGPPPTPHCPSSAGGGALTQYCPPPVFGG